MDGFLTGVKFINGILWNYILLVLLVGIGIYMTIKLKFPQFTRVMPALKKMIIDIKNKVEVEEGRLTPFQSLSTAIAAQVGTGNIVGVATAIALGGPGAAFWMILSAFFGMSTIFSEAVLAQAYRETENGELVGGPAYYIKNGLKQGWLAKIFAFVCILALGVVGLLVQSNSVIVSVNDAFGLSEMWITVGLVAAVGAILTGGMERIGGFTEKVVPAMAFAYIFGSFLIVILNIGELIPSILMIFQGAFTPQAVGGGVLGIGIQQAIRYGLARGLFSNEAGMGSTPHSHAVASTDHPAEQGFIAMIGVFISTFCICLATVMVNMTSGSYNMDIPASEMALQSTLMTQKAFELSFGTLGGSFLSIALTLFSLTTIVGWFFFAESNIKFFTKNKGIIGSFKFVVLAVIFMGQFVDPDFVWSLADLMMGLMALPNIIALIFMSRTSVDILADYDRCKEKGDIHWEYEYDS